jgi:hypothetical protein
MAAYKVPDFRERAALSKQAKQKALDQLRAKTAQAATPAPDDAAKQ